MSAVIHICYGLEADLPLKMSTGEAAFALDTKKFYLGTGDGRQLINSTAAGGGTSEDATYVHTQALPSDTWNISHPLAKFPSVTVVDSANNVIIGDVSYMNDSQIIIHFGSSFGGKAYLN